MVVFSCVREEKREEKRDEKREEKIEEKRGTTHSAHQLHSSLLLLVFLNPPFSA